MKKLFLLTTLVASLGLMGCNKGGSSTTSSAEPEPEEIEESKLPILDPTEIERIFDDLSSLTEDADQTITATYQGQRMSATYREHAYMELQEPYYVYVEVEQNSSSGAESKGTTSKTLIQNEDSEYYCYLNKNGSKSSGAVEVSYITSFFNSLENTLIGAAAGVDGALAFVNLLINREYFTRDNTEVAIYAVGEEYEVVMNGSANNISITDFTLTLDNTGLPICIAGRLTETNVDGYEGLTTVNDLINTYAYNVSEAHKNPSDLGF